MNNMCIDLSINYCATKVVGSGNVVVNGVTLSFGVLHRVRGSALLSEVNNRIGFLILDELNKDVRPAYAGSKASVERLRRGISHARLLVHESLIETERGSRN